MTEFHKDKPAGPRFDGGELEEAVGSTRVNGGRVMFLSPNFSPNFSHKKPTPNRRLIALASGQLRARKLPVARNFPRPPYALMAQRFPPWLAHACPPPYCQRAQIWAGCSRIGSSSRIQEARALKCEAEEDGSAYETVVYRIHALCHMPLKCPGAADRSYAAVCRCVEPFRYGMPALETRGARPDV